MAAGGRAWVDRLSTATASPEMRCAMAVPGRVYQPTRTAPWAQHAGSDAMAVGAERVAGDGRGGM